MTEEQMFDNTEFEVPLEPEPDDGRELEILDEESLGAVHGYMCHSCGEVFSDEVFSDDLHPAVTRGTDELEVGYNCSNCGEVFTQSCSADGCSNRCPACNKFSEKTGDNCCPDCIEDCDWDEFSLVNGVFVPVQEE